MPGMTRMKAVEMRNKLSIAYNFMAFNLFVVTVYYALKDSFPKGNNCKCLSHSPSYLSLHLIFLFHFQYLTTRKF